LEFPQFYCDISLLEDAAVDDHESYHTSLKVKAEEMRPLLQKIVRREGIVQERIELEYIQLNSDRLTERGPNAREKRKKEEGMTVRVRNLEKQTKELLQQVQSWEDAHGPFYYKGERYTARVADQEDRYTEIKDSLRKSRKTAKDDRKTADASVLPGKTSKKSSIASGKSKDLNSSMDGSASSWMSQALTGSHAAGDGLTRQRSGSGAGTASRVGASPSKAESPASSARKGLTAEDLYYNNSLHRDPESNDEESENVSAWDRNSLSSDCTACTSATLVKDRDSSSTVVRDVNM